MILKIICISLLPFLNGIPERHARSTENGLKPSQLALMARILPATDLYSFRLLHEKDSVGLSAAFLVADRLHGWQIMLVSPQDKSKYRVSWRSGPLSDSFAVSSSESLRIYGMPDEDGVTFSGCLPHQCTDTFSVLLYVPSHHRMVTATCTKGQTSYSFLGAASGNSYKKELDELLQDQLDRNQLLNEDACSPEIHRKGK